ncbi:FAD-dependent monooxygenase [Saccharopolyspora spinosa]|uniref:FAD-dependent monooxygenase n=1 Tax=Saccharopolyspora spinosa TaxID=60894 RepID=UPI00376EB140
MLEKRGRDAVRPGSRALFVHNDSLQLLDRAQRGLGTEIAEHGTTWHTRRTLFRGREVYSKTYRKPTGAELPPFASLRQIDTERFLLRAAESAGADVVWDADVTRVSATDADVTLEAGDGRSWRSHYVIAADGARSAVRSAVGIALAGSRALGSHVVVDVSAGARPRPLERSYHYAHPALSGRNVLTVPFTGGFQVDLQCRPDDDPDDLTAEAAVARWIRAVVDEDEIGDVLWVSHYQFMQVIAERFVDASRRVLLAGEAAHLFPPFGARGMNSGMADAEAAARAVGLALTCGKRTSVEDYDRVRREAARRNSWAVGAALRHVAPPSPFGKMKLALAGWLAPHVPKIGEWLERAPYGPRRPPRPGGRGRY